MTWIDQQEYEFNPFNTSTQRRSVRAIQTKALITWNVTSEITSTEPEEMKTSEELLFEAANKGDLNVVKMCLEAGISVNCRDYIGRTPLHVAVFKNRAEVVRELLGHGADSDLTTNVSDSHSPNITRH
jgi:Ankyrin repeats (3 copies)